MLEEGISVDFEVSLRSWIRYIPEESNFFFFVSSSSLFRFGESQNEISGFIAEWVMATTRDVPV
jgi:hypothetical protein